VTTTDPNAGEQKRGRHAKRHDAERPANPSAGDRTPTHAADHGPDCTPADTDAETEREEPEARDDDAADNELADADELADDETTDDESGERDEGSATVEPSSEEEQASAQATEDHAAAPPPAEQQSRDEPREEARTEPEKKRSSHAVAHHPAGASLLTAAGLVTGLALAPLLFDRLKFEVATRAADAARSAAAPWPAGGEPWFWPGWVATTATVVALVVLVIAAIGVRLPDVVVLGTAVVLAVTTARAAWATLDVLNAHLWELVPACIVCLIAFGSAVAAAFRWRSGESRAAGAATGEVAGVTVGAWLLVVLLFLGGSAIASSAQTHAFGNVTSPPQDLAGLLSVRAADAPELDRLRGSWVPQLGAARVTDDAAASAYALAHHDFTTRFPTLLVRGDDIGATDLDDSWWLSLADQPLGSEEEAAGWCSASGLPGCTPRKVSG
jgi:hypothetical protein